MKAFTVTNVRRHKKSGGANFLFLSRLRLTLKTTTRSKMLKGTILTEPMISNVQ